MKYDRTASVTFVMLFHFIFVSMHVEINQPSNVTKKKLHNSAEYKKDTPFTTTFLLNSNQSIHVYV